MEYRLQHYTAYHYSSSVSQCHNEMRMVPRDNRHQKVLSCEVSITPKPESYYERRDLFGNHVAYFNIRHSHSQLITHVTSLVHTEDPERFSDAQDLPLEQVLMSLRRPVKEHLLARQFVLPSPLVPMPTEKIVEFAHSVFKPGIGILSALKKLTAKIYTEFSYKPGMTQINTPLQEAFDNKQGVCQDFAHIAIACIRSIGLPALYVSGYLETIPPKGKEKLIGADASHAWFSVFIPSLGWVDFDPTNNVRPDARYITIACGRDYGDVSPLNGVVFGGGEHLLDVRVDMRPSSEMPVNIIEKEVGK